MKPPFRRVGSWLLQICSAVVILLFIANAGDAAESVSTLIRRLSGSSDFRVRAQAALALGASKSDKAVAPLCEALEDASTTVRASAAAALGRLSRGGKDCLEERLEDETSASVKSVIKKALEQIGSGGAKGGITSATRYYVAVGDTTDKSGRKDKSVQQLVREGVEEAAQGESDFALAPQKETAGQASQVLKKHKNLTAFYLWPKVNPPRYSGGNLTIVLEVSIFTYPGKSLKGVLPMKLTMPGVSGTDRESEDELIKMAASKAFEKFTSTAASIQ